MPNLINPNDFWGMTNLDQSDFAIPRVSIGQANTTKGKPGHFNFNSGTSLERMNKCKLIVPRKTRVLYGKGLNSRSRCSSDNFYTPSQRITNPISNNCSSCPAAQWGDTDQLKLAIAKEVGAQDAYKPLCSETYNLLMADENWSLFFISFQKTQLKVVQEKLFSRLKTEFGEVPPYTVEFDMVIERTQSGAGQPYYSTVFDNFAISDEAERGQSLWAAFSRKAEEVLAKQHEAMDLEKDEVPF